LKTALITGVSGQGGSILASVLLAKNYRVVGTSRDVSACNTSTLQALNIKDKIKLHSLDLLHQSSVYDFIDQLRPDEIYHLAAPSSVARSFNEPADTIKSIAISTVNILEAIRQTDLGIRCFVASSTEMFGHCEHPITVNTAHNPMSPYGIGKSCAHFQVGNYRAAYDMYICSGILSNFESRHRHRNYVTSKIVNTACKIALGETDKIELGNLSIERDWGSAWDHMEAAHRSLQQVEAHDYVIATGQTISLELFLEHTFSLLGLDYKQHLLQNESLLRPLDIRTTLCDVEGTATTLNWRAKHTVQDVITDMVFAELCDNVGLEVANSMVTNPRLNILDRQTNDKNVPELTSISD
jgi:GDPmannose 4,6-dehydratase